MRKRKIVSIVAVLMLAIAMLAGCTSKTMSYTYKIDNGDRVKVEMEEIDSDLRLKNVDNGFEVYDGGELVCKGSFLVEVDFDHLNDSANLYPDVTVDYSGEDQKLGEDYEMLRYTDSTGACQITEIPGTENTFLQLTAENVEIINNVYARLTVEA